MKKKLILAGVISALLLIVVVVLITFLKPFSTVIGYTYPSDFQLWEKVFKEGEENYEFESKPFSVIIPHHMAAAFELSKFYTGLSKVANPSVVVVIGPNHFEDGTGNIQTCFNCIFDTPEDDVLGVGEDLAKELVKNNLATRSDESFLDEHSIFSHTPFIEHFFSETKFVPIIIKANTPKEEVLALSEWLSNSLPPDAVVIASVDFSHYQRKNTSVFHDESSFTTINNFDFDNIYDLEVDSPPSLFAAMDIAERQSYMKVERFVNTNTQNYLSTPQEQTTSHQFIAFYEGGINPIEGLSVLSFGNIPEDDNFGLITDYVWDRNYDEQKDTTSKKLLRDIKGEEDRFFVGNDFNVFDLVDGGCEDKEQNGLKIAFCKFSGSHDYEENPLDTIALAKKNNDFVYTIYEFASTEEFGADKIQLAHKYVSAGTDIFVGRGLKEIVPLELYEDSVIFYSLGDFLLDSKLISDLNAKAEGMIAGLYLNKKEISIYFYPITVTNGYPKLKSFSDSLTDFNKMTLPLTGKEGVTVDKENLRVMKIVN